MIQLLIFFQLDNQESLVRVSVVFIMECFEKKVIFVTFVIFAYYVLNEMRKKFTKNVRKPNNLCIYTYNNKI